MLADGDVPLGVLPLGTFNHFAKDLGIPLDLAEAAAAVVVGAVRSVDVAEVNGRCFVNNSSLGVYPVMVGLRDRIREERGWGKVRSVPVAAWRVLRRFPVRRLHISGDGYQVHLRTPFVFVGNNRYEIGPSGVGERTVLDRGELCLYVARAAVAPRLVLARAALGRAGVDAVPELEEHCAAEIVDRRPPPPRLGVDRRRGRHHALAAALPVAPRRPSRCGSGPTPARRRPIRRGADADPR